MIFSKKRKEEKKRSAKQQQKQQKRGWRSQSKQQLSRFNALPLIDDSVTARQGERESSCCHGRVRAASIDLIRASASARLLLLCVCLCALSLILLMADLRAPLTYIYIYIFIICACMWAAHPTHTHNYWHLAQDLTCNKNNNSYLHFYPSHLPLSLKRRDNKNKNLIKEGQSLHAYLNPIKIPYYLTKEIVLFASTHSPKEGKRASERARERERERLQLGVQICTRRLFESNHTYVHKYIHIYI